MMQCNRHRTIRKHPWSIAVLLVALAGATACGGGETRLDASAEGSDPLPSSVISLVPSATDLVIALGASDRLVGRTDYDKDPSIAHLSSVGGTTDPSLERILRLRPDLVLVWQDSGRPRVGTTLRHLGARTEAISASSLADLRRTVVRLGQILQVPRRADSLLRAINDSLTAVREWAAARPTVRVFYLVWSNPLITSGGGTFVDSLIRAAGGVNVFGDQRAPWPVVTFEALAARDPDVVVCPTESGRDTGIAALRSDARWRTLRAVRLGHLVAVDRDLFSRPGPRVAEAARGLAVALHAETVVRHLPTANGAYQR